MSQDILLFLTEIAFFGLGFFFLYRRGQKYLFGSLKAVLIMGMSLMTFCALFGWHSWAFGFGLMPWGAWLGMILIEKFWDERVPLEHKEKLEQEIKNLREQESKALSEAMRVGLKRAELEEQRRTEVGDGYRAPALAVLSEKRGQVDLRESQSNCVNTLEALWSPNLRFRRPNFIERIIQTLLSS
jgi:hypothetical protein